MNNLPILRGTPAQVKWAMSIRETSLSDARFSPEQKKEMAAIVDSTWWIANRDKNSNFAVSPAYKLPKPEQCANSKLAPVVPPDRHDAVRFATSVARQPELAELAVLATLSRLYKGKQGDVFKEHVQKQLEGLRERLIEEIDRDIDGIRRILK